MEGNHHHHRYRLSSLGSSLTDAANVLNEHWGVGDVVG